MLYLFLIFSVLYLSDRRLSLLTEHAARRHIAPNDAARRNDTVIPDIRSFQNRTVGAYPHSVSDRNTAHKIFAVLASEIMVMIHDHGIVTDLTIIAYLNLTHAGHTAVRIKIDMGTYPHPSVLPAEQIEHASVLNPLSQMDSCLGCDLQMQMIKSLYERCSKSSAITALPI